MSLDTKKIDQAKKIVSLLGKEGTFDLLLLIREDPEKAYLNKLVNVLKPTLSRVTIFSRLKELEDLGIITALPEIESDKHLVLRYKITHRGLDILTRVTGLTTLENLEPIASKQPMFA
jgi:DNA-binding HxlR family transcriptional regulator